MIAGVVGVPLGAILSQALMKRWLTSDPVICAIGLLLSAPLLTGACLIVSSQTILTYILIFFGQLAINVNWAIVADMLLVRNERKEFVKQTFSKFFMLFNTRTHTQMHKSLKKPIWFLSIIFWLL